MLHDKMESHRTNVSSVSVSIVKGFVDFSHGLLLTPNEAMDAVRDKEELDARVRGQKVAAKALSNLILQRKIERTHRARVPRGKQSLVQRFQLFNLDIAQMKTPRSLKERRAVARARFAAKNRVHEALPCF